MANIRSEPASWRTEQCLKSCVLAYRTLRQPSPLPVGGGSSGPYVHFHKIVKLYIWLTVKQCLYRKATGSAQALLPEAISW